MPLARLRKRAQTGRECDGERERRRARDGDVRHERHASAVELRGWCARGGRLNTDRHGPTRTNTDLEYELDRDQ
jgi:hypothetical protein